MLQGRGVPVIEVVEPEEPVRWDFRDLADHLGEVLQEAEDALRLEQAVYGLDSLDELRLHQLLARGLSRWYRVQREVHYPSALNKKRTHRARCDLVLTPLGKVLKSGEEPDLFTAYVETVDPEEALWIEVKVAAEWRDVATRNSGYGGQWKTGLVSDLKKMEAEPRIREAGLLLITFNESDEVLAKDIELLEEHMLTQGLAAGGAQGRHVRSVRITERMGHRLASAAVWPLIQR